ncbi:hypothetical protein FRACYDRAFT_254789 [Fragilariopsis cylindrus CCMP1102]|uniref:PiggyBac transposable element-derived protein domain-containing protein n=1 Tax=Fragilariopsis cylindrus CCMP1102 TaxID=635003 RepID=A0A1E7EKF1_9STRA|nr:hypothetical protein FRACYDRAFT_254789 [Fragilariopsis cylindrus CCMP1102]|eukprot:OEU06358.1 hypothetical protein FRACYDRAFT_254789 [Fragilariopsis cylindrus CCMP1102]
MDSAYMDDAMCQVGREVWGINMVGTCQSVRTGAGALGRVDESLVYQHNTKPLLYTVWGDNNFVKTLSNFQDEKEEKRQTDQGGKIGNKHHPGQVVMPLKECIHNLTHSLLQRGTPLRKRGYGGYPKATKDVTTSSSVDGRKVGSDETGAVIACIAGIAGNLLITVAPVVDILKNMHLVEVDYNGIGDKRQKHKKLQQSADPSLYSAVPSNKKCWRQHRRCIPNDNDNNNNNCKNACLVHHGASSSMHLASGDDVSFQEEPASARVIFSESPEAVFHQLAVRDVNNNKDSADPALVVVAGSS